MDAQLKRGMLEVCVLSVLQRGDSYGYQMVKDLSGCIDMSESTLYPILKRLEAASCLTVFTMEHNGRLRKFYHLTDSGQQRITDFLDSWKDVMAVYTFIREGENHE